ncbi:MAG: hypothetical protein NPIRA04_17230 [Nitrospirales bacterium]|nr:MAG: hypothetical protein NPIRA04_17230 [Nitrospirales bacterium]
MTSQPTILSISILFTSFTLFAFTTAFALPPEHKPLKPRVPIEHRAYYRSLHAPMYQDSLDVTPELLEAGSNIYQRVCVNCHGKSGTGNGISAGFLPVLPRDFTNCLFQHKRTDGELFYVIKFGSWPMPPMVPSITEDEAWTVIPYLRTFCQK